MVSDREGGACREAAFRWRGPQTTRRLQQRGDHTTKSPLPGASTDEAKSGDQ